MADNSNKFSISGLIRNRQLSGLHAHRPENSNKYFDYIRLSIDPQFVSILGIKVVNSGINYSKSTTTTLPSPEHPSGIVATAKPWFTPSKASFSINNPGSGYSAYQAFDIMHSGNTIGDFIITSTGINGSISDYEVLSPPLDLNSTSSLPYVSLNGNSSAVISSNDKFSITYVDLTSIGAGYQTLNRVTGSGIIRNIVISNQGSSNPQPTGLSLQVSMDPYIHEEVIPDPRKRQTILNKFMTIHDDISNKKNYIFINNFSLGDPLE
jgi:hypothetical protein